ncbi:MAG: DUF7024 domain-containing protein [Candidatus Nanopelagicales bacterium]
MQRRPLLALVASLLLLGGYAAAASVIIKPEVGRMYRAYFIDHRVDGWHTSAYEVPESEGIDFTRQGRPLWIRSMIGLSVPDANGTWTDARLANGAAIRYRVPFEGQVCVQLQAAPSPDNVGGVSYLQMGTESQAFRTPTAGMSSHAFQFQLTQPSEVVRIYPGVTERKSARDRRLIGLQLQRLIVTPGPC